MAPKTVSFFVSRACNMRCRFCYSAFREVDTELPGDDGVRLIRMLANAGVEKVSFVGGEPTLHPHIVRYLMAARNAGMTTVLITNGAALGDVLTRCWEYIDWVGLNVDSASEMVEQELGRGCGDHVARMIRLARVCKEYGIKLKLNTVVTALSVNRDMGWVVEAIAPDRWKAFQVMSVKGQNDGRIDDLLVTPEAFAAWVERHKAHGVVAETNDLMDRSYALIDPAGRFFSGGVDGHRYGLSILEAGVHAAWKSVEFREDKFVERGGLYDWRGDQDG